MRPGHRASQKKLIDCSFHFDDPRLKAGGVKIV